MKAYLGKKAEMDRKIILEVPLLIAAYIMVGVSIETGMPRFITGLCLGFIGGTVIFMVLAVLKWARWVRLVHEKALGNGIRAAVTFWGPKIYTTGVDTLELELSKEGSLRIKGTKEPALPENIARRIAPAC